MRKSLEEGIKERLTKEVDKWFPKGKLNERGSVLTFFGAVIIEIRKLIKAFGGCEICYGKGYATSFVGRRGFEDFGGEGFIKTPTMHVSFCSCSRGKQLKELFGKAKII